MEEQMIMIIAFTAMILLTAIFIVIYHRNKTKKIMQNLNHMLENAIAGDFTENSFDESMQSAIEAKMSQYLFASTASKERVEKEKEIIHEMISDISHQTKTPLSNMMLYTSLLSEKELLPESKECITALESQTEKLNFLIGSLVKLSRLETGILSMYPKQSRVQPLLIEAVEQVTPKAKEKGIGLSLQETDITAVFDDKWTIEAIYNVLDNAVKYTPSGGSVSVSCIAYDLFCRIDIKDTGIGIAEEEQAKIWKRFYRSPAVSSMQGVGIGLYLTSQIISGQGGYMKVSSAQGMGTVFSLFLPRDVQILQNC